MRRGDIARSVATVEGRKLKLKPMFEILRFIILYFPALKPNMGSTVVRPGSARGQPRVSRGSTQGQFRVPVPRHRPATATKSSALPRVCIILSRR